MMPDKKRENFHLLTDLLNYFLADEEDEMKRSLHEEGRVFIQSSLEEYRYNASFGLMLLSNDEMDLFVKVDYVDGTDKGDSYSLDIRKRGNQFIVMTNNSLKNSRPFVYQLDYFKAILKSKRQKAFLNFMAELDVAKEAKRVTAMYQKKAEAVLDESFINYCLDNRRFDLLETFLEKNSEMNTSDSLTV